ncbi:hypothetical protein [Actinoplanes derwentensis]|uniref:Uncharacterized protein n=1 Tax=Actinoplanes derwentensis TaxID=113562 RepID=A0A1H2C5N4_9ACTN|nr:hypothetical protein [Actinoplanes derwentensis]GID84221.1 hypothetical protein Ade03nite_31450 [Actinoplanes derwentensis]SDT65828.1 hypothetical protein SAMN04489716_5285 [Actinoplanes derwentensis]
MVRGTFHRLVSATAAAAVALALSFGAAPAAHAAPKAAPKPTAVSIAGADVAEAIVVRQEDRPKLFQMLMSEVNWLATASSSTSSSTSAPKAAKLGPKYTVTLLVKDAPNQVYHLYPLAAGGPRAHRPAKQPGGKKPEGWFYGRLSMPEALRLSGAPVDGKPDVVSNGIGGGVGTDLAADDANAMTEVTQAFGEFRQLFLLNGAILLVILTGLAGMAFLIRRRV